MGYCFADKMKLVLLMSFCLVFTLSRAYNVVSISVISMSLIPPRMMFPLDILQEDSEEVTPAPVKVKNVSIEDDAARLRRSYIECIEATHVKLELVRKFKSGKWAADPSLKRWALCVLVRMDMMSQQGVYRYDTAMHKIKHDDRQIVDRLLDKCLSKKAKPAQEIAWDYLKCHSRRDSKNKFPSLGIMYTI